MKIIADKDWINAITKLADALLKAYWTQWMALATQVLWSIKEDDTKEAQEPKMIKKDLPK